MSRIVIFGSSSGLGSCLIDQLNIIGHNIIPISSSEVDFNSEISIDQIHKIIEVNQPDVIINCAGVLGNNQDDFNKILI